MDGCDSLSSLEVIYSFDVMDRVVGLGLRI